MIYMICPNCKTDLIVEENDCTPGCREMEEVFCPCCKEVAGHVFTSGRPSAQVLKDI